jgi:hypothetical protein
MMAKVTTWVVLGLLVALSLAAVPLLGLWLLAIPVLQGLVLVLPLGPTGRQRLILLIRAPAA